MIFLYWWQGETFHYTACLSRPIDIMLLHLKLHSRWFGVLHVVDQQDLMIYKYNNKNMLWYSAQYILFYLLFCDEPPVYHLIDQVLYRLMQSESVAHNTMESRELIWYMMMHDVSLRKKMWKILFCDILHSNVELYCRHKQQHD